MSHRATNWAIQQRGLKPATKILLWNLADCHNPSHGCFPSQKYLAEQCEMTDRTVREHLSKLETLGLISRTMVAGSKGYDRTEYVLNFDLVLEVAEKSSGGKSAYKPPEKSSAPHRKKFPTNLVSNNPVRKPARARDDKFLSFYADWVNGSKPLPPSVISSEVSQLLVSKGYVTRERMIERVG